MARRFPAMKDLEWPVPARPKLWLRGWSPVQLFFLGLCQLVQPETRSVWPWESQGLVRSAGLAGRPEITESVEGSAWLRRPERLNSNDGLRVTTAHGLRGR